MSDSILLGISLYHGVRNAALEVIFRQMESIARKVLPEKLSFFVELLEGVALYVGPLLAPVVGFGQWFFLQKKLWVNFFFFFLP